jgi:hypothetical protein
VHTLTADALLSRLDGVRATGRGRWVARCPSHGDSRPSLSVRELDDGRVLVHDFAGCAVADVLTAVGLEISDLFPDRAIHHRVHRERDPHSPRDVLLALSEETQVAAIVAARIACGCEVDQSEVDRLWLAVGRIACAADQFRRHPADGHRRHVSRAELDEMAHEI